MRVGVVGATGAVGRQVLQILAERSFPFDSLTPFATERSAGLRLPFGRDEVQVKALDPRTWFEGIDLAFVSAGSAVSREIVPTAASAGTVCIDNSSAFREVPGVPLVVPEINPDSMDGHSGMIANPNCTALVAMMPLWPLHERFGLRELITSSYQSTSGAGIRAVRELSEQIEKLHGQEESLVHPDRDALPEGDVLPRTIAFNVVPQVELFDPAGSGYTTEELKMGSEFRKVFGLPDLKVAATAVRVPVVAGHGVSVYARFAGPVDADSARETLREAPGVLLVDEPAAGLYPTPLDSAGQDRVLVGRIRSSEIEDDALVLWAVGDNLRKGAALNMVQIAELFLQESKVT